MAVNQNIFDAKIQRVQQDSKPYFMKRKYGFRAVFLLGGCSWIQTGMMSTALLKIYVRSKLDLNPKLNLCWEALGKFSVDFAENDKVHVVYEDVTIFKKALMLSLL